MAAVARRSTVGSFGALGGRVPTCSAVAREGRREDGYGAVASVRHDRRQDGVRRRSAAQRRPMGRRRRSGLRGHGYEQFGATSMNNFIRNRPKQNLAYGGYHQTWIGKSDAELTEVGPDTPCGEYLRRFWHPMALTSELGTRPKLVQLLGEDLVLFRDKSDRIGLVHRRCPHRRSSLEYGVSGKTRYPLLLPRLAFQYRWDDP